jgi:hypothetical protein
MATNGTTSTGRRRPRPFLSDEAWLVWSVTYRKGTEKHTYRRYVDDEWAYLVFVDERGPFAARIHGKDPGEWPNDREQMAPDSLLEQWRAKGWSVRVHVSKQPSRTAPPMTGDQR